jgi:hypothetical protein
LVLAPILRILSSDRMTHSSSKARGGKKRKLRVGYGRNLTLGHPIHSSKVVSEAWEVERRFKEKFSTGGE